MTLPTIVPRPRRVWPAAVSAHGPVLDEVRREAGAPDADLVVMGKHGQSVAEDLLLGSVSKHVLAEGTTDVLVSTSHDA